MKNQKKKENPEYMIEEIEKSIKILEHESLKIGLLLIKAGITLKVLYKLRDEYGKSGRTKRKFRIAESARCHDSEGKPIK